MQGKRVFNNAAWIIGCKILQSILGVFITMLTARYLGPSNYGLINYASSVVAFVLPIAKLGLDSTLVNELVKNPKQEGQTIGTAMLMSLASSVLCILGVIVFVTIANFGETVTLLVCALYSVVLLTHAIELIQFWFQAHLLSKYTSIATLIAYLVKSGYQIFLLMNGSAVWWFALTSVLDILIIDVIMVVLYYKANKQPLHFSWSTAKQMFAQSKYYIISSMMVTIFVNTDRIMLKLMTDDAQTGLYSAAVACASLTSFVFSAIIYSAQPVILEKHKCDKAAFEHILTLLYSVIIYLSLAQCIIITVFAPFIIKVLYGEVYALTVEPLRWIVWYTTFSYLGAVRNIWIIAEEKHSILWKINLVGALGNVVLNLVLIPIWGITGAAIASLLTQIITNVVLCFIFREIRPTLKYLKNGMNILNIFQFVKSMHKK